MKKSIINKAIQHLHEDANIAELILNQNRPILKNPQTPFNALCKTIIFQQLSGKSANAIYQRFRALYNEEPSVELILNTPNERLRKIGVSYQKIKYLNALAAFFLDYKDINFNSLSDKEISEKLIKIKGIGQWTIDIFLMFTLFRTDILPLTDLGIKKGFKLLYNLNELPEHEFMINKSKLWSPYKTIASIYIWGLVDSADDNW